MSTDSHHIWGILLVSHNSLENHLYKECNHSHNSDTRPHRDHETFDHFHSISVRLGESVAFWKNKSP